MRLKTAPRVILGLVVVGALAYGVNYYIDNRPKPASPTIDTSAAQPQPAVGLVQTDALSVQSQPVPQPVPRVQMAPQPQAQVQPAPQPAPAPTPQRANDAGLDNLLK